MRALGRYQGSILYFRPCLLLPLWKLARSKLTGRRIRSTHTVWQKKQPTALRVCVVVRHVVAMVYECTFLAGNRLLNCDPQGRVGEELPVGRPSFLYERNDGVPMNDGSVESIHHDDSILIRSVAVVGSPNLAKLVRGNGRFREITNIIRSYRVEPP